MRSKDVRSRLRPALDEQIASGCPGVILAVDSPRLGLRFADSAGAFERGGDRVLEPEDAFRAASVAKAVTAAVAAKRAEEGLWSLDDSIARHLPGDILDCLRVLDGLDSFEPLSLRCLLGHTSGLPDYFFDAGFQARVRDAPDRTWRPTELVEAAARVGRVLFAPGTDFSYGDTGYVLVGLALEEQLERPLSEVYRSIVFDPLGMATTWLEWHELPRSPDISHHYDGETDLRGSNLSFDWAGGGLATTASDLSKLLRGIFGGTWLGPQALAELTDWRRSVRWRPRSSARYVSYGLGIGTSYAYGERIEGATGVWGAFAWYCREADACISGTVNLVGADRAALMDAVVQTLVVTGG